MTNLKAITIALLLTSVLLWTLAICLVPVTVRALMLPERNAPIFSPVVQPHQTYWV